MRRLRAITAIAMGLTFGLILLGAWVRATNSGLSCPDWPTCYGFWLPLPSDIPADAGYFYYQVMLEWVHRLIAGVFLGPLILVIAWLCFRLRDRARELLVFGVVLVLLLLVQVILGGVTVLDQNSPWSVAVHLTTALLLFATMWLIFERAADRPAVLTTRGLAPLALVGWLLLLATIASAAVMSKSGASLACSSPLLCEDGLVWDFGDPLAALHMTHRLLAFTTFFVLAFLGWRVRKEARLRGLDRAIGLLLIIQIALGVLTVLFEVPITLALIHQANGILLFSKVTWLLARILQARTDRNASGYAEKAEPAAAA
ncbi:MAG: COX15/CtaA family protein [Alphaproteobacteria bacterium]|nr:COX15/CtaA family protein [Alphaproteobacteria bacterium]